MKAIWFAVCMAGVLACGSDDADEEPPGGCDDVPSFGEVTAFSQVCTNCHNSSLSEGERNGAPVGYDFDEYESARDEAEEIAELVEGGAMPPPGYTITAAQRAQVIQWAECGAPE